MKKYSVLISMIIFLFSATHNSAQDLILKKDGNKIFCRIVEIDSSSIFYLRPAQRNISVISKAEVQTYYTAKPQGRIGKSISDSVLKKEELIIIRLVGGFANPIGDFGSKDLNSETAGWAKTGLLLNASLILKFSKNFGFSCDYRYQKNAVDNIVVQQAYSSLNSSGAPILAQATNWVTHGFFGGLYFNAPIIKKISFDFSLLAGLPEFESPQLTTSGISNGATINVVQNVGKTSAFAYVTKMGFLYKFEKVALNIGLSYFTSKPTFSGVLIQASNGSNNFIDYAKFQQRVSNLNIEAGISFLLFH